MNSDAVKAWVSEYERGWREDDLSAVRKLFTEDARYARSPYDDALLGHEAIEGFWLDDPGTEFTMTSEPVAVEGDSAVVRVEVQYTAPRRREYRELWVLRFADDGRVADFEEWTYWPDKPNTVEDEQA
jgi:ketosteroid isomerase-like protein